METKQCRKCGYIHPVEDAYCPMCGEKHKDKISKMWLFPAIAIILLVIMLATKEYEMQGLIYFVVLLGGFVAICRVISRFVRSEVCKYNRWIAEEYVAISAKLIGISVNSEKNRNKLRIAAGASIGGLLAGEAGFIIGGIAARGKEKPPTYSATFMVDYANGRSGVEVVEAGSARYDELIALVK